MDKIQSYNNQKKVKVKLHQVKNHKNLQFIQKTLRKLMKSKKKMKKNLIKSNSCKNKKLLNKMKNQYKLFKNMKIMKI